ncbi:unnamed protein product [Parnassius apollo]|uniref:(apollo) hypothetical protein n=1 Tax=Parnassius apollo TaxID=110799 RepID=A0A8S3XVY2_PARAO|nr:unnamed protein product [Parnassius apollo]
MEKRRMKEIFKNLSSKESLNEKLGIIQDGINRKVRRRFSDDKLASVRRRLQFNNNPLSAVPQETTSEKYLIENNNNNIQ